MKNKLFSGKEKDVKEKKEKLPKQKKEKVVKEKAEKEKTVKEKTPKKSLKKLKERPKKEKASKKTTREKTPKGQKEKKLKLAVLGKKRQGNERKETAKQGKRSTRAKKRTNSMGTKILIMVLPVIVVCMATLTVMSVKSSSTNISDAISAEMEAELNVQGNKVTNYFTQITDIATTLAYMVNNSYQDTNITLYENALIDIVKNNDNIIGSGIWFESGVFPEENIPVDEEETTDTEVTIPDEIADLIAKAEEDKEETTEEEEEEIQYVAPYAMKENGMTIITDKYESSDNSYFKKKFYLLAKEATEPLLTEPLYDIIARNFKVTAVVPMHTDGVFIGCVTVDVSLGDVQEFIAAAAIGEGGKATLLSEEGKYLAGSTEKNISKGLNIQKEENASLAKAGETVIKNESGQTSYEEDGDKYLVYYNTLDTTGWKIMISIPEAEVLESVNKLTVGLIIICLVAVVITVGVVILGMRLIINRIKSVNKFAVTLASGDFSIEPVKIKSRDELGVMAESLNTMYENNRGIIESIATHTEEMDNSSNELHEAAMRLAERFRSIQNNMNEVNGSMMTAGAATEQVNASAEEVLSSINILTNETEHGMKIVSEIKDRAGEVGENSQKAYDSATELSIAFEKKLKITMQNAKVVENIGEMAATISSIADEIDLLSLNASIEAARAGESGKGFAVVAKEIGKLAKGTEDAVDHIQKTIVEVQKAFEDLNKAAEGILDFVKNTVTPDYDNFIGVAEQYGNDAEEVASLTQTISEMTSNIKDIMTEVTEAIQSIAQASQTTADISNNIMTVVDEVNEDMTGIEQMSDETNKVSSDLNGVVGRFKL